VCGCVVQWCCSCHCGDSGYSCQLHLLVVGVGVDEVVDVRGSGWWSQSSLHLHTSVSIAVWFVLHSSLSFPHPSAALTSNVAVTHPHLSLSTPHPSTPLPSTLLSRTLTCHFPPHTHQHRCRQRCCHAPSSVTFHPTPNNNLDVNVAVRHPHLSLSTPHPSTPLPSTLLSRTLICHFPPHTQQ
jgi:hypothetical protein